jgi:hypothetical protein
MSKLLFVIVVIAAVLSVAAPAMAQDVPTSTDGIFVLGAYDIHSAIVVGTPTLQANVPGFVTITSVSGHVIDVAFKNKVYIVTNGTPLTLFLAVGDTASLSVYQGGPAHADVVITRTGNAKNLNKHVFLPCLSR